MEESSNRLRASAAPNRRRRLVTIGHSYCVALNRRLADAMARVGGEDWEVTAIAPAFFHGDLYPVTLEPFPGEANRLVPAEARLSKHIHLMHYGPELRETLRQGWDVVHCWEEPYIVSGAQVAKDAPRDAVLVYTTFQNNSKRYPPPFNWIEGYSMRRAAGWIGGGESVQVALSSRPRYADLPNRAIPLGVDQEHFRPDQDAGSRIRRELGWQDDGAPVIGYLGRLVPEKGLGLLTRVLDQLDTPWRALFVGTGPMLGELREWSARYGDRVRIITSVRHDEVPAYLNAMSVLCAPSQTAQHWREQLGRMLIEAFACGIPVLGSDSGEIPAVVADAGIIIPEADEAAWLEALSALLADPARRAELGRRGIERARNVFSWSAIARQHLDFFTELLDERANGRR